MDERERNMKLEWASIDTKQCKQCGLSKPLSEFHKQPCYADGMDIRCKTCVKARAKEGRQTTTGPKRCSKCKTVKPRSEFFNSSSTSDGKACRCKLCHKAYRAAHQEAARAARDAKKDAKEAKSYDAWRKQHGEHLKRFLAEHSVMTARPSNL